MIMGGCGREIEAREGRKRKRKVRRRMENGEEKRISVDKIDEKRTKRMGIARKRGEKGDGGRT